MTLLPDSPDGGHNGIVDVDGTAIEFRGLEPLTLGALTVKNRVFRSSLGGRWDNYDGSGTPVNVIAQSTATSATGGIHEVEASQVVALQGSGTASGPKGNVFINSNWSYSLTGLYQIAPEAPWGFNVSASLNGREGYPLRYARRVNRAPIADTPGVGLDVPIASDANTFRFPDVHLLDLRVDRQDAAVLALLER